MFDFFKRKPEQKESATRVVYVQDVGKVQAPDWNGQKLTDEGYRKCVIAYTAITRIARGVSSLPILLMRGDDEIIDHPILRLLQRPNPAASGSFLFEQLATNRLISGNAYLEAAYSDASTTPQNKPPVYLYSLPFQNMSIIAGTSGIPAAYMFKRKSDEVRFPVTLEGKSNIMHWRTVNPSSEWYGQSPIAAAAQAVDTHNLATNWNASLLANGSKPSGALVTEGTLEDAQFNRLKLSIEESYTGAKNAGKPMVLEGGLEWVQMSLSPQDMDFLNSKNVSAKEIALAFGFPPPLLGITGDSTYNNLQEAKVDLWVSTIIPIAEELLDALNNWLVPMFDDSLRLIVDRDSIDALQTVRDSRITTLAAATFLTDNEKRALLGYGAIDGGDTLYRPASDLPIDASIDDGTE